MIKKLEEMDKHREKEKRVNETRAEKDNYNKAKANLGSALQYQMVKDNSETGKQNIKQHLAKLNTGASTADSCSNVSGGTGTENNKGGDLSRTVKEKSPPADKFEDDEREPIFV